jgi:acyl carrier protein/ribosome-associated toxin RatA of RatAB toxin-antitoxin module
MTTTTLSTIDRLLQILRLLQIDGAKGLSAAAAGNLRLEADLGMDSQEIVDLTCEIERSFSIELGPKEFTRNMSLADVAAIIERASNPAAQESEEGLEESIVIAAEPDVVYGYLHRMADWPRLLPHVDDIRVIYDDGRYQEFTMAVQGADGSPVHVRSVRRCESPNIAFFQPEPPVFLRRHRGGWRFEPLEDGSCRVVTFHRWILSDRAAELYGPDPETARERVRQLLTEHARLALVSWKSIIEGAAR